MTDLTHALRAMASSLKDRAAKATTDGHWEGGFTLGELAGACEDAADSLEHRWRTQNEALTGKPPESGS